MAKAPREYRDEDFSCWKPETWTSLQGVWDQTYPTYCPFPKHPNSSRNHFFYSQMLRECVHVSYTCRNTLWCP